MKKPKTVTVKLVVRLEGIPTDAEVTLYCVGESDRFSPREVNRLKLISKSGSGHTFNGEVEISPGGEERKYKLYGLTEEQALAVYTHENNRSFFGYHLGDNTYMTCFSYYPRQSSYSSGVWWFVDYSHYPIIQCGFLEENMFITPPRE